MRMSICRAMCLLGRTAIDKVISVKADSLYLLRRAASQPVKSPNIVSKRSSRSNRWKPILVEAGLPGQIGSVLSTTAVRGKYRLRSQEGQKGRVLCLCDGCTPVFGSAYRDLGSRILGLGFQILKFKFQNLDFNVWSEITVTSGPTFAWE